jgi:hypothetical protein
VLTPPVLMLDYAGPAEALRMAVDCGAPFELHHCGPLARAGHLAGRRCTTHFALVDSLRREEPSARVQDDCLFVDDDVVLTSLRAVRLFINGELAAKRSCRRGSRIAITCIWPCIARRTSSRET